MSISTSVLAELIQALPNLRPQIYFKSSLTALSHAMEDQVLAGSQQPLVIASFQQERFYRQEAHRYRRIAQKTDWLYVLSPSDTDFGTASNAYETVAFDPTDALAGEWHLVVVGSQYATCLICRECPSSEEPASAFSDVEPTRRFEGIWTFERQVSQQAAEILLGRISAYRPELAEKVEQARTQCLQAVPEGAASEQNLSATDSPSANPDPFVERLVTYLQAGQYKLLKAYRSLAAKEQKERLVRSMTSAIRRSLDPEEILQAAVQKLGEALGACRCIVYRCGENDARATINHEFLGLCITSLKKQNWLVRDNPLIREAIEKQESLYIEDTFSDPRISDQPLSKSSGESLQDLVQQASISAWLLVPVSYQGELKGMVELHHCGPTLPGWTKEEVELVEAVATQVGIALVQAEAYANLEYLNQQLEDLERTRSNLVAITGHELRTPLSTIQVCLESLASEPEMSGELQQAMLNTALTDAERLHQLVQDFLTLSQFESGRAQWHPEPLSIQECIDLSISHVGAHQGKSELPPIRPQVSDDLPLVEADGEWLVEVLAKLLDNACKFTSSEGEVSLCAKHNGAQMVEVSVSDTGRGIEPNRLKTVFDPFYQEEGALQRTTGGTGLGLAICRQIVNHWGGNIWAESAGREEGTQFYFTVPVAQTSEVEALAVNGQPPQQNTTSRSRTRKNNNQ
ncbi:MAG: histidine kinase [Cyanobacteria bacterium QS_4_48_99]|nr:MAG: histidine kinase [Cyanobacteria bacterium QS_4_48_99]